MKLNDNEVRVLEILKLDPYVSQQYIADQLLLSRPAVANLISGLQEKGFILGKPYMLKQEEYITCVGGANLDHSFQLESKMILKTSNPVKSTTSFGGVIRNVAENLARLNHKVSLMTIVGDDNSGNDLLSHASKYMEIFASDKKVGFNTGGYYSIMNHEGEMDIGYADMSIYDQMDRSWIIEHKKHLSLSSWIITDMNVDKDGIEALIEFANNEEKKLAVIGVSGPKMKHLPKDLYGVEILICNLDEAQSYFESNHDDLSTYAKLFLDKGVKNIVITQGVNGSLYANEKSIEHRRAMMIDRNLVVDVTGAGDAFSGAVLHGLIHGESLDICVSYGIVSSSLTIQSKHSVNSKLSMNLIKKELKKYENL